MVRPAFPAWAWRKSSFSGTNGDCVEVAVLAATVGVRDSKDPQGAALAFRPDQWRAFVAALRTGEFA